MSGDAPAAESQSSTQDERLGLSRGSRLFLVVYLLFLAGVSFRIYRTPVYSLDSLQYMGNALLMEQTDIVSIHHRVYAELRAAVPNPALAHLLGSEPGEAPELSRSRQERASNPYRYGQFLPLFAIRPLYNQALYVTSKSGLGLVRSGVLISVASYFGLGVLLFLWLQKYTSPLLSCAMALLSMLSPPLVTLGRETTSDALATLIAFAGLYLLFEEQRVAPSLMLLLASIYFRTDFVVLVGPILAICWLQGRVRFWQALVLGGVGVASVLLINHFAGDYGIKMLYYRNFVGTPIAPAEMTVQFSFHDYLSAFRSGITKLMGSFFIPFLAFGILGIRSKRTLPLLCATVAYVALHFLILPNWEERWFGVFYLSMVVCVVWSESEKARARESLSLSSASTHLDEVKVL